MATLERIRIGGTEQWILERAEDARNPLVLFLHGGPGTSQLTWNRRNTRALEKHFVVVNWDQRGAGKSYDGIHDVARMNIEQFVADTHELTLYLLRKFHQQRLVLVGHSWGSVIGILAASRHPELYHCYVGIGQIANMRNGELVSYAWTLEEAKRRNDAKALRALVALGPPPYTRDWQRKTIKQRSYVARFGGEMYDKRFGALGSVLCGLVLSPEYTLPDRLNYLRGMLGSMRLLWPQLMTVDLFERVPRLNVPVIFMEGRHDHEVPSEISERYFRVLEAPSKETCWFEKSGHLPNTQERDLFNHTFVKKVLPLVMPSAVRSPSAGASATVDLAGSRPSRLLGTYTTL